MNKEKIDIFDFLKSITYSKEDLSIHERFNKDYQPFMINRWLSMSSDLYCITMAMYLSNKDMDKLSHYKFLLYELPKKYIKFTYQKSKYEYDKDIVNLIKEYYNVSYKQTSEILKLLTEDNINEIKNKMKRGGKKK